MRILSGSPHMSSNMMTHSISQQLKHKNELA